MKFTAQQIAGILEGDVIGNPEVEVSKLSKIEEGFDGSLTFLANPKYTPHIYTTKASITIVNKTFTPESDVETTLIRVDDAYLAFSKILEYYNAVKLNKVGIEQPSFISKSSKYGENVYVGAFSYIADNVKIGNNVTLWSGNHIGHHSTISDHAFLASHVVVSGGVEIGEQSFIGVNATLRDHIKVGRKCVIGAGVLLLSSAGDDSLFIGSATEKSKRSTAQLRRI